MHTLNRQSRAIQVAEKVRRNLQTRRLREGERFMTEAELARRYGVSRGIAREAVGRLRALGVLDSRQRKGIVVGRVDPIKLVAQSLPMYHRSPRDLLSLARLRYVLEVGSVELAVRNATDDQIRQLAALAQKFAELRGRPASAARANEIDLAFHGLLLAMTGEPLVAGMHKVLAEYFHLETATSTKRVIVDEATYWQHQAIVNALQIRDVEQARALLRQHLQWNVDVIPSDFVVAAP